MGASSDQIEPRPAYLDKGRKSAHFQY